MLCILDMDGVLYRGKYVFPQTLPTLRWLRENHHRLVFMTNNGTRTRSEYVKRIKEIGIKVSDDDVMTSAYAAGVYLKKKRGKKIIVAGEKGLEKELRRAGVKIVDWQKPGQVDYVVAGMDLAFSYEKLSRCQQAILDGAEFIATNTDNTWPGEDRLYPGAGAMIAAIEAATGRKPVLLGKPEPFMLKLVLETAKIRAKDAVVVGDRLETDIAGAKPLGITTVLVLSGVTNLNQVRKAPLNLRPDFIIKNIDGLKRIIDDLS